MADAVFTGNGDRIVAVLAGDTDFTVDTILTGFAFRTGDGDTIFSWGTIFTVKTADCDAIGAVQANMAILAVDADLAVFTVLARLADCDVLGQFQIIRDLAIFICRFMEQDVLASIDAFILFIILTSCRAAFYSQCRMRCTGFISFCVDVIVDLLQITKVCCIFQIIAGCCSNRGSVTFCIFGTIKSTLDVRDLVAANIDIATRDGSRTISTKGNLGASRYVFVTILSRRLVTDGRNARQVFCQLDFQLTLIRAIDTDVAFCQVLAVRTADDFHGVVQLLSNDSRIITLEFQAVFHGSYLVFTGLICVDDTGQARSIHTIFTVDTICSIIAILDRDIDSVGTILAIGTSRTREADMADTVFTGNGDRIIAVLAGDADFAVDTILTGFTLRTGDGDTVFARCTIFAVKTADRDAVRAVQANMAIPAVDADLAVFTVFTRLTDIDILGQLQIIRDLAIFIRGFVEQDVLASIDVLFCLFILSTG